MIKKIELNGRCERKLAKIYKKDKRLFGKIEETFKLFKENPEYSSLKLHKIGGKKYQIWSIFVKKDFRILFEYVKNGILVTDIGSHDEVY
ncbi:MAG: type II toxin-antitoxin system RelE/ParE family toxin [Candidatus Beckwithbacteria bacterium]|nr:type II toxin-antitoxin system RelE/ParE family toxin [Patescibacteria group bacterium]